MFQDLKYRNQKEKKSISEATSFESGEIATEYTALLCLSSVCIEGNKLQFHVCNGEAIMSEVSGGDADSLRPRKH